MKTKVLLLLLCLTLKGILCSNPCKEQNASEKLLGPDKALEWLDFLEWQQPEKLKKIKPGTLKNLKCRADCDLQNCCAMFHYKKALKIHQLNQDRFLFNYNNDSMHLKASVKNGYWDGIATGHQKWFLTMNMTLIAYYQKGRLQGPVWRLLEENGFLVSDNLESNGTSMYIYPGLKFGLYGEFSKGKMVSAKPVKITGFTCLNEMLKPQFEFYDNVNEFAYDPASSDKLSSNPTLRDPLEEEFLEVQTSSIEGAGQGVFMKKDVEKGTVIGFFNGITITLEDTLRNDTMKHSVHKMWNDWYTDEMVWIPPQYIDINAYNASLGHKINHNSDYNVDAGYIDHPRFGKIRSIVTTQDIQAGQEIFCQYSSTVDTTTFVRQMYKDFSAYLDLQTDNGRSDFLQNMERDYKVMMDSLFHDPDKHYKKP